MTTAKHTPGPWQWQAEGEANHFSVFVGDAAAVSGHAIIARLRCEANAAHIVRCVNAHDDLVAALREMIDLAEEACSWREQSEDQQDHEVLDLLRDRVTIARAALVKAQG